MTGVQRFASELLRALDQLLDNETTLFQNLRFTCLIPGETEGLVLPGWKNIQIRKCGRLRGNLWEQFELPFFARHGLLLSLCNIGPVLHFNQVIIFHDASVFAVPQAYSLAFKLKHRIVMWVLGRTARQVLTDSQFSRDELAHFLKIKINKIMVNPGGCEHILRSIPDHSIIERNNLGEKPFLLTIGSSSPHKNVNRVIMAIDEYHGDDIRLVISGGEYSKVFKKVQGKESEHAIHLGYVYDSEMRALFENALCFIFPSLYEGFGLPPLEAMACGCPVICSNSASMPEVCRDAALYFDPLNLDDMNHSITQFLENRSLRDELKRKGFERVKYFTWNIASEALLDIIRMVV